MNTFDGQEQTFDESAQSFGESAQIQAAKPQLVILSSANIAPPENLAELQNVADVTITDAAGLKEALLGAEILLLWDFFSEALKQAWDSATSLRWIHIAAAGVDSLLFKELVDSDVVVTNAHGVFDTPIAEFVLASILAQDKQLHRSQKLQEKRQWQHRELQQSSGKNALIIGTGGIGRATARLLHAVGMNVRGVGRTAREADPDFTEVLPSNELGSYVDWADHIVLIAPLTEQTRGIINAEVLAAMKPSAHVINVGRGALIREAELLQALEAGRIAAASLDVFDQEPLPAEHPFWGMDNVQISAHMSGDVIGWRNLLATQFEENLWRWLAAETLHGQVDKKLGYVKGTVT